MKARDIKGARRDETEQAGTGPKGVYQDIRYLVSGYREIHRLSPSFLPLAAALAFAAALQPLAVLFFSARILDELSGGRDLGWIIFYAASAAAANFVLSAAKAALTFKQAKNSEYMFSFIRITGAQAEKYATMDFPYSEDGEIRNTLNDIETRMRGNGVGLMQLYWSAPEIFQNALTLILAALLLSGMFAVNPGYAENFFTSPAAAAALALIAAAGLITTALYQRKEKPLMEAILAKNAKGNSSAWYYHNYIKPDQGAKDIRIYRQSPALMEILEKSLGAGDWMDMAFFWSRLGGYAAGVMGLIGGAAYLFIGMRALSGMYEIGAVVQYTGAVTALAASVSALISGFVRLFNNGVYVKPLIDFLRLPDKLARGGRPTDPEAIQNYAFEFRNVSFKYPGAEGRPAFGLKNLNLTLRSGQRLAVVGLNGSGKTTMVKLLCRLYDPDEGEILLNGVNIKEYDYAAYHRLFSVVFQDFKLFPLPVAQNIAASLNPDEARVKSAAADVGYDGDTGATLYKAFDENGTEVSGGEAQKIALARALYKNAPVVVLDEPTSALDPISEFEVYTAFNKTIGGKTAVFISHRLSSCRFCHDIAVFEGGELIQRGGHEELLAQEGGRYYALWNAQAWYYNNER